MLRERKKEVIEELIESYSEYKLTVTKKLTRSGGFETYNLIFTKGEEKVHFELNVHSSDTEIINYLNEKITQSEGQTPEGTEPEGTEPEGTEPEGTEPEGTEPEGTEPEGTEPEGTEPEGTEPEGTEPEGTEPEGTDPEGTESEGTEPEGTEPGGQTPERPTTGFSGLMGVMGLGSLSLGGVFSVRKKK